MWETYGNMSLEQFSHEGGPVDPGPLARDSLQSTPDPRRTKYHRGPPMGMKVWVFGLIERGSNRLVVYPVQRRDKHTLIPIITRHVERG